MNSFKEFWNDYKGAIIGIIIAILVVLTGLDRLILAIVLIVFGAIAGNYIQNNKDNVKYKLKDFIDRF